MGTGAVPAGPKPLTWTRAARAVRTSRSMGDRPGERSPNGQPVAVPLWAHPRPLAGRGPASDRRYRAARAYRAGVRPTRRGKWRGGGRFVVGDRPPVGAPGAGVSRASQRAASEADPHRDLVGVRWHAYPG